LVYGILSFSFFMKIVSKKRKAVFPSPSLSGGGLAREAAALEVFCAESTPGKLDVNSPLQIPLSQILLSPEAFLSPPPQSLPVLFSRRVLL